VLRAKNMVVDEGAEGSGGGGKEVRGRLRQRRRGDEKGMRWEGG
jgi:hypothetical protein